MSTFKIQKVIDGIKERPKVNKLKRQPVYRKEDYIVLIKKHYKECGLPEPDWLDEIPDAIVKTSSSVENTDPKLFSHDWVSLVLEYDETQERVNCRLSTALHDLYRDYYSQGVPPPIESLVRAYKDLGFSDEYLMRLIDTHDRRITKMKKYEEGLDKIFKPDSSTKKKKKKEKQEIVSVEEEEEDEDEEMDEELDNDEENHFDMEEDEDDEQNEEDIEEEYISD